MQFMVEKAEKRKLEDGKDTLFSRGGNNISQEKLDHFKKRRIIEAMEDLPVIIGKQTCWSTFKAQAGSH
jgi:hypothetical protein